MSLHVVRNAHKTPVLGRKGIGFDYQPAAINKIERRKFIPVNHFFTQHNLDQKLIEEPAIIGMAAKVGAFNKQIIQYESPNKKKEIEETHSLLNLEKEDSNLKEI